MHVTALYPWLAAPTTPEQRTELAEVLADQSPVELTVDRLGRFPEGVLFLVLSEESEASVRALTRLLVKSFPACVPYGGAHPDPHPHVTVAMGSPSELDAIQGEVAVALDVLLPMTFVRREVVVMEQQPDGTWSQAHRVALGADRS